MGHYAGEMFSESEAQQQVRLRRERIWNEVKRMPLSEFTAAELQELLIFMGFAQNSRPPLYFLSWDGVMDNLEKKIRKSKK